MNIERTTRFEVCLRSLPFVAAHISILILIITTMTGAQLAA